MWTGSMCGKWQHETLPGEHPHVDDSLMHHPILEGVWRCWCLILGLDKKQKYYTTIKHTNKKHA